MKSSSYRGNKMQGSLREIWVGGWRYWKSLVWNNKDIWREWQLKMKNDWGVQIFIRLWSSIQTTYIFAGC
ncbi:unnamed protein product [Blepharisma stoltei]|uniref:Uncharacterized protein n=1 Tax=Blepharisma stoltei TaxID=1481888 RepID=A0AAU9JGQ3_9CILI|nr:unnamed protein product [Blepharisma stoltei]